MKNRIHGSWADLVSMTSQFFGHSRAKDELLIRMVQNVEADHPGIEIAIIVHHWRSFLKTPINLVNLGEALDFFTFLSCGFALLIESRYRNTISCASLRKPEDCILPGGTMGGTRLGREISLG